MLIKYKWVKSYSGVKIGLFAYSNSMGFVSRFVLQTRYDRLNPFESWTEATQVASSPGACNAKIAQRRFVANQAPSSAGTSNRYFERLQVLRDGGCRQNAPGRGAV